MTLTAFQGCALDGCETPGQKSYTGKTIDNQIVMRTSLGGSNDKCQNILLPTSWGDKKCKKYIVANPNSFENAANQDYLQKVENFGSNATVEML